MSWNPWLWGEPIFVCVQLSLTTWVVDVLHIWTYFWSHKDDITSVQLTQGFLHMWLVNRFSKDESSNFVLCVVLPYNGILFFFLAFDFLLLLRGHSVFSSPPQWPMTSDFEGFSIPDFIHHIFLPILTLQKEPVSSFLMLSAKQGNYWYHFYNVFGMTLSLTGNWTRDLPHSKPALYH